MVKNLFYKIGDFELKIPYWPLASEGVTALTGPSGSGKTSVLKILCGLILVKKLSWIFKGQDLAKLPPPDRHLAICFQDLRLFPHFSAKENILFALTARRIPFKNRKKEFQEMIDFLDLKKSLNLRIDQLSGGEQQRVALARALITRPRFLFLDEPFSYLDEKTKDKARELTFAVIKKYKTPLLLISHDKKDLKSFSTEEFYLEKGGLFKA